MTIRGGNRPCQPLRMEVWMQAMASSSEASDASNSNCLIFESFVSGDFSSFLNLTH